MAKIRILYGLEASGGGALKHLVYLATRLNKDLFDISVILSNKRQENIENEIRQMQKAGANVLLLPIQRKINPVKDFKAFLKIYFYIKKREYDIVHAHSSKAGGLFRIAAWLNRVPVIYYTPHCFYFQGKHGIIKWFFVILEKNLAKITTRIIVSESEKKEIQLNKIAKERKVLNINNAIDFDEYRQTIEIEETKKKIGIKNNPFIVGAIGRLVYQKDWKTYIYAANEVLRKYSNVVFLIIGAGELYFEIKKLISDLNLEKKVILTGYIKDIYKVYGIIDVYVNTSLWEGLPYVFLEAMKYKIPIVATDTGNGTTIVHEETGFISPVKNYKTIAEKIMMLIQDKKMAFEMGVKGNEWLTKKYSFELFIQQHEMLYKSQFSYNL